MTESIYDFCLYRSDPLGIVGMQTNDTLTYMTQRARGAYIASVCQPEASFNLFRVAQTVEFLPDDIALLNKRLRWQITNKSRELRYVKLDQDTLQLVVFTDSSFANNKDLSSQIGYVICLADATKKAKIIHWSSLKCKRVTRSVLAAELYGMAHGFNIGAVIKATSGKILDLCQSYARREITEMKWIHGHHNPADSMTKAKPSSALKTVIDTNRINISTTEWVERASMKQASTGI